MTMTKNSEKMCSGRHSTANLFLCPYLFPICYLYQTAIVHCCPYLLFSMLVHPSLSLPPPMYYWYNTRISVYWYQFTSSMHSTSTYKDQYQCGTSNILAQRHRVAGTSAPTLPTVTIVPVHIKSSAIVVLVTYWYRDIERLVPVYQQYQQY